MLVKKDAYRYHSKEIHSKMFLDLLIIKTFMHNINNPSESFEQDIHEDWVDFLAYMVGKSKYGQITFE